LELSIECYRLALDVRTRAAYPEQWAMTQMNLAILYAGEDQNEVAIHHYQQALEIFTPAAFPIDALKANRGLGNIYFQQGSWQLAIHAYETAMQSVETSRSWVVNEESRRELLENALSIYENAIQCAINLQNSQAIEFTERIRSRQLVELMETKGLQADVKLPPEIATYLAKYEDLNQQRNQGKNRAISLHITQQQIRNLTGEQFTKYHPSIIEYFNTHSPAIVSSLSDRITKLEQQQSTLDLDAQQRKNDAPKLGRGEPEPQGEGGVRAKGFRCMVCSCKSRISTSPPVPHVRHILSPNLG
jgi:tetratricopeptide (TPR) repeat protein